MSANSLNKKIRNAQLNQFNYIVVIGEEESKLNVVDVRARDGTRHGKQSIADFTAMMLSEFPDKVPKPQQL